MKCPVILCAAGDTHGALNQLYTNVVAFEVQFGVQFDHILHVGDFGIWPSPDRVDRATRNHDGAGDFPDWLAARRPVPRPTTFIAGNHEDFDWLDNQPSREVLPGLFYLGSGATHELCARGETLQVGGIGGCFGPADYVRPSAKLQGGAKRHYTRDQIDRLGRQGYVDIVLMHDAPAGVRFPRPLRGGTTSSSTLGLDTLLEQVRPRVCFFGHYHMRFDALVAGVPCLGLNKGPHSGSLVAIEIHAGEPGWRLLGEWPGGAV